MTPDRSVTAPTSPATKWWTLAAVAVGTFMLMLDLSVVNIALPVIRHDLDASFTGIQWVIDAYALTLAVFLLTAGALADNLGRKAVFQFGFVVFVLSSLACGLAGSVLVLDISRGVQGIGGAVLFAVGPAMISHEFEAKQRGTAFGVFGAVIGLAFASGPLIGGSLITAANWRWIFFLNIPVGILAILVTALRVRHSRDARARGVDLQGLLVLSAALTALVLGLIRAPDDGWTSAPILALGAGAAALLGLFVLVERRRGDAAMLDLRLFGNLTFIGLSAVALLTNVAGPPSIFLEANFVENILHLTPWQTGVRFLPLTCTILVFGAIAGGLTSVVPVRLLLCLSAASIAGGLLLVRLADQHSNWTVLLPSMIVTGIGMGAFNPPRASTAILVADPDRAGMASGASETFQQIGIALGIAAIGSLFEHQVTENFVASSAGVAAADAGLNAHQLGRVIASGGIDEVTAGVPAALGTSIRASGEAAFMHGFSFAFLVLASVCALSAVVALLLIRQRDLRQGDELYAVAEDRVPAAMQT